MRARSAVVIVGALLMAAGAAWGVATVFSRERGELEVRSPLHALGEAHDGSLVLGAAPLVVGDDVLFETCADDALAPSRWDGTIEAVVWPPDVAPGTIGDDAFALRVPLDAATLAHASRDEHGACVEIGHAPSLGAGGTFTVGLLTPGRAAMAHERTSFFAHVIAVRPSKGSDTLPLLLVLVGAFMLALALAFRTPPTLTAESVSRGAAGTRAAVGTLLLVLAIAATALVPFGGATVALVVALVLALVQIGLALFLSPPSRLDALALRGAVRERGRVALLISAPLVGVVLLVLGKLVEHGVNGLFPQRGAAPIEAFVSWPSASLAVALVAVVAPVAEEIFFRGLLYGALSRATRPAVAFVVTALLFWLAHAPQDWGDPGALASLALVSLALTGLRASTGSTALCVLAHLTHNAVLALLAR